MRNCLSLLSLLLLSFAAGISGQSAGNWTQQTPQNSPSARDTSAMAYDSSHSQTVLFGGIDSKQNALGDTWLWDGSAWTQSSPQTSPTARWTHAAAYDSMHHQTVVFGGQSMTTPLLNDTWTWDGSNWTQASPAANPPARFGHTAVFDSTRNHVVLFGGESFKVALLNDTWVWDGANWTQKNSATAPPARYFHAVAFDAAHGQMVLFGGSDTNGHVFSDTWVWDGANWTQMNPKTSPPARSSHAMAYDFEHAQVVLFGGVVGNSPDNGTWIWDGAEWSQASPATSPPARNAHVMSYDSAHDQIVLFGGYTGMFAADTWTFSGAAAAPVVTAIANGASFANGGVVPGEIATAFGTNLTSSTGINLASALPLPKTILTDSLLVNNQPVALFAVDNVNGQQQFNFQVPWEVASGPKATIAVSRNGADSAALTVPVLPAQPGIFNYSVDGQTFGAILHANFQLADTAHPAKPSEVVLIYCTGLGAVSSPPADGAAGNGQATIVTPTVTIGGTKAIVSFSGLAPGFAGLYQVNAEVPPTLKAGNQAVVIELGGASSNSVLLPVQ